VSNHATSTTVPLLQSTADCQSPGGLPPGMALGCRLTSVRGNRGEKNTKNEPLVHQNIQRKKNVIILWIPWLENKYYAISRKLSKVFVYVYNKIFIYEQYMAKGAATSKDILQLQAVKFLNDILKIKNLAG
jgi:hypothetical protein